MVACSCLILFEPLPHWVAGEGPPPGQNLMQDPVTVSEGVVGVGHAHLPDLQPSENRLLNYTIDLGSGVKTSDSRP